MPDTLEEVNGRLRIYYGNTRPVSTWERLSLAAFIGSSARVPRHPSLDEMVAYVLGMRSQEDDDA